jgi:hypothetical protein
MLTQQSYRGQITRISYQQERVLGLKQEGSNDIISFCELFERDLLLHGQYIIIDYLFHREPIRAERVLPRDFSRLAGFAELLGYHMLTVGFQDFFQLLEQHLGWFVTLNVSYNHVPGHG